MAQASIDELVAEINASDASDASEDKESEAPEEVRQARFPACQR